MNSNKKDGLFSTNNKIVKYINYLILTLSVSIIFMPILIIVNIAFKTKKELGEKSFISLPDSFFNFDNFMVAINKGKVLMSFKNTFIQLIFGVIISLILSTMTAYILNRFEFKLRKAILTAFIGSITIPFVLVTVSIFNLICNFGIFNTRIAGIVLYSGVDIVALFLFLQYLSRISYSLDESALIDGASYFRIYRSIILPQLKPAIATAAIMKGLGIYNDLLTPMLYMPSPNLRTITIWLNSFSNDHATEWTVMCAGIMIVLLPTLIAYLFLQKYIINGVSSGAIKG